MRSNSPVIDLRLASTAVLLSVVVGMPAQADPTFHGVNERPTRRLSPTFDGPLDGSNTGGPPPMGYQGPMGISKGDGLFTDDFAAELDNVVPDPDLDEFWDEPDLDGAEPAGVDAPLPPGSTISAPGAAPVPGSGALPLLLLGALTARRRRRA